MTEQQTPAGCPNPWHDSAPARTRDRMRCPECPPVFDPYWVRNLVERVGRELHDLDMLAGNGELDGTSWGRGHRAGFERAAEYLASSVRQSTDRLGLADLLDGARAGLDVAALSAIPQRVTKEV